MGFVLMKRTEGLEDFNVTQFTILNWCGWAVAALVTILRLGVRWGHRRRLYWDDGFCILAMICLTIYCVLNEVSKEYIYMLQVLARGGTPGPPFDTAEKILAAIVAQARELFGTVWMFFGCLWACKFSLLMFYRKLIIGVRDYMRWWWTVVGVCILTLLMVQLSNLTSCIPLKRRFGLENQCNFDNAIGAIIMSTTVDVVTDVMIMALPIRLLIGLRITMRQKVALSGIFGVGLIIVSFSITRAVKVIDSLRTLKTDITIISLTLFSLLEASVAVIVVSLPTLKSLITSRREKHKTREAQISRYDEAYGAVGQKKKQKLRTSGCGKFKNGPDNDKLFESDLRTEASAPNEMDEQLNSNDLEAGPSEPQEAHLSSGNKA